MWVLSSTKSKNPEFDGLQTIQRGMLFLSSIKNWPNLFWWLGDYGVYVVPRPCLLSSICIITVLKCIWSVSSWALLGSLTKSLPPYSLMYLLFKSVILIFIATFCECSAPIGFIKEKRGVWKHRIGFFFKSLQTRQSESLCHSLYHQSFYHVSISLSLAFLLIDIY